MGEGPRWAYVRARVMARHGDRPDAGAWRVLEATTDAAAFLLSARKLSVGRWLDGIEADDEARDVERALRRAWMERVRRAAEWPPTPWAEAVRWLECLPFLEIVDHLLQGRAQGRRFTTDPVVGVVAQAEPSERGDALDALGWGALRPLDVEGARPWPSMPERWRRALEARLPVRDAAGAAAVRGLVDRVAHHRDGLFRLTLARALEARRDLARRLHEGVLRFRHGAGGLFHHLALEAFDAQRLRAGLVVRLELPGVEAGRTWV